MWLYHLSGNRRSCFYWRLLMLCLCCSELRERIQPEILELIKQQRLNRLCEGSCFRKLGNRRRQGTSPIILLCWSNTDLNYQLSTLLSAPLQRSSGSADSRWITKCCTMVIWMSHLRVKCLLSYWVTRVSFNNCLHCLNNKLFKTHPDSASSRPHCAIS